ncbi:MAG: UDP-2,3-diacylglucosamine diphosphatase [bacterium]
MRTGKKIYFVSDMHFGIPDFEESLEREKRLVGWLNRARHDAEEFFLLGDIFDFWFEYRSAVPYGYTRFLGKIAELTDSGIPVHFFTGNHDLWTFDYLPKETGVILHRGPLKREINGKIFLMAHGDGLGPSDKGFKLMKRLFTNRLTQHLFRLIHPDIGIKLGMYFSRKSRESLPEEEFSFKGEDKEFLVLYAKGILRKEHIDYFIFGHRHVPVMLELNEKSVFINIGDWITHFSYAVFDGKKIDLLKYEND